MPKIVNIRDKFLEDISTYYREYNIENTYNPVIRLINFLIISDNFGYEVFWIYKNHYRRIFTILEILADKQGLDIERQVFNLVRNHITNKNIKLTVLDLVSLYLSHNRRKIVYTLRLATEPGIIIYN